MDLEQPLCRPCLCHRSHELTIIQRRLHHFWIAGFGVNKKQQATDSCQILPSPYGSIQTLLSSDCLCSAPEYLPHNSLVHSCQLHAYEQEARAKLNQTHDGRRALQRERDDVLRDLIASKGQT